MRLPPLNAVRTFEAAGRHENFSRAAAELGVTPGAVSRQIKLLEEHLGLTLFVRRNTDVRITRHGQIYLNTVQNAFGRLEAGTQEILVETASQPLHIWGSRFFIRLWLVPHLAKFHALHPTQELIITSVLSSEPIPPEIDLGIRFGNGNWPGLRSHFLIGRNLIPVCSPDYLERSAPLREPADLANHILLQNLLGSDDWNLWYAATQGPPIELGRRIVFTSADVAYSAALDGLGIALGREGFIERDLREGRIVTPIDFTFAGDGAFYLVYHDRESLTGRLLQFRRWILDEVEGFSFDHP